MEQKVVGMGIIASLLIGCVFLAGCSGTPSANTTKQTPIPSQITPGITSIVNYSGPTPGVERSVVAANNQFAFDMYTKLCNDPHYNESNLFYSPISMSSALAITYEGARGSTADEIQKVFHFPKDDVMRREGFAALYAWMNQEHSQYVLRTANALWAEKTYLFLPDYIRIGQQYYSANVTNLDFIVLPEESRVTINRWVENQTNNKIQDLLPSGSIDRLTRLVITNAVYFYGTWAKQFDKNLTSEAEFKIAPGKLTHVQMMERTDRDAIFNYTETDNLQVLEMQYTNGTGKALSMIAILPKGDNLTVVEKSLDLQNLSAWRSRFGYKRVDVFFPKFKLNTKYNLNDIFGAMGMPTAFTFNADFSGMDGTRNLYITDIIHQAFVDVNEEGTEAAAATGVVVGVMSIPQSEPPVFRADHPFIFVIQDSETGNILFIGRVINPNG